mgnify:CR=1 FL=1
MVNIQPCTLNNPYAGLLQAQVLLQHKAVHPGAELFDAIQKKTKLSSFTPLSPINAEMAGNTVFTGLLEQNNNLLTLAHLNAMKDANSFNKIQQQMVNQSQINHLLSSLLVLQQNLLSPAQNTLTSLENQLCQNIQQDVNNGNIIKTIGPKSPEKPSFTPLKPLIQTGMANLEENIASRGYVEINKVSTLSSTANSTPKSDHSQLNKDDSHSVKSTEGKDKKDYIKPLRKKEKFIKKKFQPKPEPQPISHLKPETLELLARMAKDIESLLGFGGIDHTKIYILLQKNENNPEKAVTRVLRNRQYYRKFFAVNK